MQQHLAPPSYNRRGEIYVNLSRADRSGSLAVPGELRGIVLESEWTPRLTIILEILHRFHWSLLNRLWLTGSILLTILSFPLVYVLRRNLTDGAITVDDSGFIVAVDENKLADARLIQFGVFAGIAFLCWAPWLAFAFVGRKRLDNTLKSMTAADAGKGTMMALVWSVVDTSVIRGRARLLVRLPPAYHVGPSAFHPDAYMPSYLDQEGYAPPTYPPAGFGGYQPDTKHFDGSNAAGGPRV